jgi:hypothetical protein
MSPSVFAGYLPCQKSHDTVPLQNISSYPSALTVQLYEQNVREMLHLNQRRRFKAV